MSQEKVSENSPTSTYGGDLMVIVNVGSIIHVNFGFY